VRFASLGSGSKGNATLVQAGDTLVMVDCGFSVRETERRMQRLGVEPGQLDAILVTHEHSDHCAGVARLSKRYSLPVYLTHGTAASGRCEGSHHFHRINGDDELSIGALQVRAIAVPHDANEPCQFRFQWQQRSLGVLTDLGCITPHVVNQYRGCDSLLLEFNHDVPMLSSGPYPPALKRRVGGDWGHLSNEQAAQFLRSIDTAALRHLVVAHISEHNNCRERAQLVLDAEVPAQVNVVWAEQAGGFGWLAV